MNGNRQERDRGVLTKTDREFLTGEKTYKNQETASHRRRNIRTRLRNSILDLSLLFELFDEHDDLVRDVVGDDEEVEDALADAIALIFCGVTTNVSLGTGPPMPVKGPAGFKQDAEISGTGDHHSEEFLKVLGTGLSRGFFTSDGILLERAELNTETTRVSETNIRRTLEEGRTLHPKTAALLLRTGQIDPEAVSDLAREQLLDDGSESNEE